MFFRISAALSCFYALTFVNLSFGLNVLFISDGRAGHLTPMFELAKAMNNHNITFLTERMAQSYIDLDSFSSPRFRLIYVDNSTDALLKEKHLHQQLMDLLSDRSLLTAAPQLISLMTDVVAAFYLKIFEILTYERFDAIVADHMMFGVPILCKAASTPCILQGATYIPSIFDLNLPHGFSLLTENEMTQLPYRIYNTIFTGYATIRLAPLLIPTYYRFLQSLPQGSGPFQDMFTLKNVFSTDTKCLQLLSIPSSFFSAPYPNQYQKYLGAFIDETPIDDDNSTLTAWVKSKPTSSIIFGAFGSSSIIPYDRMYNLINGLAKFLLQTNDSFLLLALRDINYKTYETVLKDLSDGNYRQILENKERIWIEQGFVKQKWILRQTSVKIFFSHCGMGSILEALYFMKPIVCMPFNMDQFMIARRIENLKLGQSLFIRSDLLQSLLSLGDFTNYTFTDESVAQKVSTLWTDVIYEQSVERMSLEIKHSGGTQRAVKEIEFFVKLNGSLDNYTPFANTLPFYQRYPLDLLFIFIILPVIIIRYILSKCCKKRKKTKTE